MTYWDANEIEVEDIMTEFLKKSLAQSEFDTNLNSYVYSIHDLQLDFLKHQLREDPQKEKVTSLANLVTHRAPMLRCCEVVLFSGRIGHQV